MSKHDSFSSDDTLIILSTTSDKGTRTCSVIFALPSSFVLSQTLPGSFPRGL